MRLEDIYNRVEEQAALARILFPRYLRLLTAIHELVASLFAGEITPEQFRLDDTATRKQLKVAAEQVVLIDAATRRELRAVLREGQQRGYSDFQMAHGVPEEGYGGIDGLYLTTWKGRSATIARTEVATASVAASLDRYAATGLVTHVRLHEHTDTDAPCVARNGQIVPLSSQPGLLHPNCQVGVEPIVTTAEERAA